MHSYFLLMLPALALAGVANKRQTTDYGSFVAANLTTAIADVKILNSTLAGIANNDPAINFFTLTGIKGQNDNINADVQNATAYANMSSPFTAAESANISSISNMLVPTVVDLLTNFAQHKPAFNNDGLNGTILAGLISQREATVEQGNAIAAKLAAPYNTMTAGVVSLLSAFDSAICVYSQTGSMTTCTTGGAGAPTGPATTATTTSQTSSTSTSVAETTTSAASPTAPITTSTSPAAYPTTTTSPAPTTCPSASTYTETKTEPASTYTETMTESASTYTETKTEPASTYTVTMTEPPTTVTLANPSSTCPPAYTYTTTEPAMTVTTTAEGAATDCPVHHCAHGCWKWWGWDQNCNVEWEWETAHRH